MPKTLRTIRVQRRCRRAGMTLVEVLVVMAILMILIGTALTAANTIRQRAAIDLTRSLLGVIDTALLQYHTDHTAFPPVATDLNNLQMSLYPSETTFSMLSGNAVPEFWPSQGLYHFLNRSPNSRSIIGSVSDSLVTSKDNGGQYMAVQIFSTIPAINGTRFDLVRFVDAWGTSLSYQYSAGDAFPTVTSAGPDKRFGTGDDIVSD